MHQRIVWSSIFRGRDVGPQIVHGPDAGGSGFGADLQVRRQDQQISAEWQGHYQNEGSKRNQKQASQQELQSPAVQTRPGTKPPRCQAHCAGRCQPSGGDRQERCPWLSRHGTIDAFENHVGAAGGQGHRWLRRPSHEQSTWRLAVRSGDGVNSASCRWLTSTRARAAM